MIISKGEFCQFSLKSRVELLKEFGNYICHRFIEHKLISLYQIYGFYVEMVYDIDSRKVEKAEPLTNLQWISFYEDADD